MFSLTKRQKQLLDFIEMSTIANGYAPSLDEMKSHLKLRAISTVHEHIENLKIKGYIKKDMNQARGIQIVKSDQVSNYSHLKISGVVKSGYFKDEETEKKTFVIDDSIVENPSDCFALLYEDLSLNEFEISRDGILVFEYCKSAEPNSIVIRDKDFKILRSNPRTTMIAKLVCMFGKF